VRTTLLRKGRTAGRLCSAWGAPDAFSALRYRWLVEVADGRIRVKEVHFDRVQEGAEPVPKLLECLDAALRAEPDLAVRPPGAADPRYRYEGEVTTDILLRPRAPGPP
jgi:hypothetical protein